MSYDMRLDSARYTRGHQDPGRERRGGPRPHRRPAGPGAQGRTSRQQQQNRQNKVICVAC